MDTKKILNLRRRIIEYGIKNNLNLNETVLLMEKVGGAGGGSSTIATMRHTEKQTKRNAYNQFATGRLTGRKDLYDLLTIISTMCATHGISLPFLLIRSVYNTTTYMSSEICDIALNYENSATADVFKQNYNNIKDAYFYKIEDNDYGEEQVVGIIKYAASEGTNGPQDVKDIGKDLGYHVESEI